MFSFSTIEEDGAAKRANIITKQSDELQETLLLDSYKQTLHKHVESK
jgi:hypothetical protein